MGGADAVRQMLRWWLFGLRVLSLLAFFSALILTIICTYPLTYAAQERRSA
jgi:ABC-type multidrug transport system permease subunit